MLTPGLLPGQDPADLFQKAPPAVDEALRARIQQFYQHHVDGKFRLAEQFVAEESKDDFYSANKPRCLKFEVPRIDYTDQFTRAKATIVCTMFVNMPGFINKPLPVPLPSHWKIVDGVWYWYLPPVSRETPFGTMNPGQGTANQLPASPLPQGRELEALADKVKADRRSVAFRNAEAGAAEVVVTNTLEGNVKLSIEAPKAAGLQAEISPADLKPNGKAVLTIKSAASQTPRQAVVVNVHVAPLGQVIPIQVTFGP